MQHAIFENLPVQIAIAPVAPALTAALTIEMGLFGEGKYFFKIPASHLSWKFALKEF